MRPVRNSTACSSIPITIAAPKVTVSFSILPITAAASARSKRLGPSTAPIDTPWIGSRNSTPRPDRPAATTHTTVWRRFTGMPRSAARSADSAEARTATPILV